ncbi:hypothetical protein AB4Z46_02635 [Variovorax sp. M-6]|uniref:hypothetical protein n=1 Tax=Variovorax sp. M-6 TaxID=3233041 RepID=UPI003F9AD1B5
MSDIKEDLDQATQAYKNALKDLAGARQAHEEGPGKGYADMLAVQADLRAKIAAHEASAAEAQGTFQSLFAKASHIVTKEVKAALFAKNDALAIAEELRSALAQSEAGALELRAEASCIAEAFRVAHAHARAAYARMEVCQALEECGQAMGRAVALATHIPGNRDIEKLSDDVDQLRAQFVWKALMDLARELPEWDRVRVEELGALDLGPFNDRRHFTTPAAVALDRKRRAMAEGQGGTGSEQLESAA